MGKQHKRNNQFKNINNKRVLRFWQLDAKDFYPSIKGIFLHEALKFAKENVIITTKDIKVIFQKQK